MIDMQISSYRPRKSAVVSYHDNGGCSANMFTSLGVVKVVSFPGSVRDQEFTSLEMFIWPHIYRTTLPRSYSIRWFARLAGRFAERCTQQAAGRG